MTLKNKLLGCFAGSAPVGDGDAPPPTASAAARHRRRRARRRRPTPAAAAAAAGLTVRVSSSGAIGGSSGGLSPPGLGSDDGDFHDAASEFDRGSSFSGTPRRGASVSGDAPVPSHPLQDGSDSGDGDGGVLDRIRAWLADRAAPPPAPAPPSRHGSVASAAGAWSPPVSPGAGSGRRRGGAGAGGEPPPELDDDAARPSLLAAAQVALGAVRLRPPRKPRAGASTSRRADLRVADADAACCWADPDARTFLVRGADYMATRVKVPSPPALYRLLGVDAFSFDRKMYHVAQHVHLPPAPRLGPAAAALPAAQRVPPLLVVNLQLPTGYPPPLLGGRDGPGVSLVYYFGLPDGWEPGRAPCGPPALALWQRFCAGGREADGAPTRERLKLIPRVANIDEWAERGPLNGAEARLLRSYTDKPMLTRPQQRCFAGGDWSGRVPGAPAYLEIDLDVHSYAFIARKAFWGYVPRLAPVVFENAFVVQGNRGEELPEAVVAAARVYRIDLARARPYPGGAGWEPPPPGAVGGGGGGEPLPNGAGGGAAAAEP